MNHRRAGIGHHFRNRRGGVLVLTAGAMAVMLGMAALAIDVGMLYTARSEAQRAAEAGAHAGAVYLLTSPNDADGARERAKDYAERNQVRWVDTEVHEDEDIDVEVDELLVRVRVHQIPERAGPVSTFFARVLGINAVNVGASAAAQVWPADGVECLLPFAAPDRWETGDGGWPDPGDTFDPEAGDWYDPEETGYRFADRGTSMRLYAADPDEAPQPSWWYAFCPPGVQCGGNRVRERIEGCFDDDVYRFGEEMDVEVEPGAMVGPVSQGFESLIEADPDAAWEPGLAEDGCVSRDGETCLSARQSPRIRPMVLFNPESYPEQGRSEFTVENFISVFIQDVGGQGNEVEVDAIFLEYTGLEPAEEWYQDDSTVQMVRIVE